METLNFDRESVSHAKMLFNSRGTYSGNGPLPGIDAHNHLWGKWDNLGEIVRIMNAVGVVNYADLTANVHIEWGGGGYLLGQGNFDDFIACCKRLFPSRFYGFTTATFAQPIDRPLFSNIGAFLEQTVQMLSDHVQRGARGLKILKELGLHYRDALKIIPGLEKDFPIAKSAVQNIKK